MPAKSISQLHLMQAALHNADFAMARKIRQSMSPEKIKEFTRLAPGAPKKKSAK